MTATTNLSRDRIAKIKHGATYTLDEFEALCDMAIRAAAGPEAPSERVCARCNKVYEPSAYPRHGECDDCFFERTP